MQPPIGLIAGEGKFPFIFAEETAKRKRDLVVIALKEEMNYDLSSYARAIHTISVAKLDQIIQTLKKEGVKQAVMAGRVKHTKLFSELVPDLRAAALLFKVKDRRADSVLAAVAAEMKKDGIELLPSTTFLEHLIPQKGYLTKKKLDSAEEKNVEFGIQIAQGLTALDIGQTVIVKRRTVVAVEAMEGTDACIRRAASIAGDNVIVVKSAKPQQDLRFDVPVIGTNTIKVMGESKARVLAIQAGKTLMLEKDFCVKMAENLGITIYVWEKNR